MGAGKILISRPLILLNCIVMFLIFICATVPVAFGQAKNGLRQIQPVPGFSASEMDISKQARKYFDFIGPVDLRFDDRVVVGDRSFKLPRGKSFSVLRKGDTVGIRVNEAGEVVEARRLSDKVRNNPSP